MGCRVFHLVSSSIVCIWCREPPPGRYFGTVPAGVSACPLMLGASFVGWVERAVSWLYAVGSAVYSLCRGRRGIALIEWKYRGSLPAISRWLRGSEAGSARPSTDKQIQTSEDRQPKADGRRRPAAEPSRPRAAQNHLGS